MNVFQHIGKPYRRGVILYLVVNLFGTFGYMIIDDYTFMDALFMTVITVSTVGYGEVKPLSNEGEIFTMVLMFLSLFVLSYTGAYLTTHVVSTIKERKIQKYQKSRKMKSLTNHVIICGYGNNGRQAAEALKKQERPIVIIEKNKAAIDEKEAKNYFFLNEDATDINQLHEAGVEKAAILLSALPEDSENLYVTLTSRQINPNLYIIARAISPDYVQKLRLAGTNEVLLPSEITGKRMAELAISPDVVNFFDNMMLQKVQDNNLSVIYSTEIDKTWMQRPIAELANDESVVISIKKKSGEYLFRPDMNMLMNDVESCLLLATNKQLIAIKERLAHAL